LVQFFLAEQDVGKNRAEATLPRLTELNERVKMTVNNSPLTEEFLKNFTVRGRPILLLPVLTHLI